MDDLEELKKELAALEPEVRFKRLYDAVNDLLGTYIFDSAESETECRKYLSKEFQTAWDSLSTLKDAMETIDHASC